MNNKDELLKQLLQEMLERLMEGERTALLGYNKHEFKGYGEKRAGNGNSRNGYYERDLLTGMGLLDDLKIPRDRFGELTPELFDKYQRSTKPMDNLVLSPATRQHRVCDAKDQKLPDTSLGRSLISLLQPQ